MSDSHDNTSKVSLAVEFFNNVGADVVFHLGDIISPFTLKILGGLEAEVYVLYGNNDGDKVLLSKTAREIGVNISDQPLVLELGGLKVIAIHGWGSREYTKGIVEAFASSGKYDIVLYGHTHEVEVRRLDKVLVVNPGEVHGYLSGRSTIALIDTKKMSTKVVKL